MDRLVDLALFAKHTCTHDVHISPCSVLSTCGVLAFVLYSEHCVVLKFLVDYKLHCRIFFLTFYFSLLTIGIKP